MRRWVFIIGGIVVVGFFLASGCAHLADVTYPDLTTAMPEDMRIYADDDKRALTVVLTTTNAIAASASECFLNDDRGRRYRLELEPAGIGTGQPIRTWYKIRAYGPVPSPPQLVFGNGAYSISFAYANVGDRGRVVIERRFVIHRYSIPYPIVWIAWLFNPHGA